jgi:hypothetical protein
MKRRTIKEPIRARKGKTVRGHDGQGPSLPKHLLDVLGTSTGSSNNKSASGAAFVDQRVFSQVGDGVLRPCIHKTLIF